MEEYLNAIATPWLQLFDAMQFYKKAAHGLVAVVVTGGTLAFLSRSGVKLEVLCMLKSFHGILGCHALTTAPLCAILSFSTLSCLVTPASIVIVSTASTCLNCHETARATNNEAYLSLTTEGLLCDVRPDTLWRDCIDIKREVVEAMLFYASRWCPCWKRTAPRAASTLFLCCLINRLSSDAVEVHAHSYFLLGTQALLLSGSGATFRVRPLHHTGSIQRVCSPD